MVPLSLAENRSIIFQKQRPDLHRWGLKALITILPITFHLISVLPQAVTHFEELVGMAEALLKGGVTTSTSSLHSHAVWKASNSSLADTYTAMHSNSSSPITLNGEDEEQQTEKQVSLKIISGITSKSQYSTNLTVTA